MCVCVYYRMCGGERGGALKRVYVCEGGVGEGGLGELKRMCGGCIGCMFYGMNDMYLARSMVNNIKSSWRRTTTTSQHTLMKLRSMF